MSVTTLGCGCWLQLCSAVLQLMAKNAAWLELCGGLVPATCAAGYGLRGAQCPPGLLPRELGGKEGGVSCCSADGLCLCCSSQHAE